MGPITLNGLALADGYVIPTIPDVLSTYGIPQIQRRVKEFSDEIGRQIVELGVVITKYRSNSTVHQSTVMKLRRDPSIQNVLPTYLHESNSIAGAAEFRPYGTLKTKYGTHGQFDQFRGIAHNIMVEAQGKL
jgi:chromosome partitioning protein